MIRRLILFPSLYCSSFCHRRRIRWSVGNRRRSRVQERRFRNDTPLEECPGEVDQLTIFSSQEQGMPLSLKTLLLGSQG